MARQLCSLQTHFTQLLIFTAILPCWFFFSVGHSMARINTLSEEYIHVNNILPPLMKYHTPRLIKRIPFNTRPKGNGERTHAPTYYREKLFFLKYHTLIPIWTLLMPVLLIHIGNFIFGNILCSYWQPVPQQVITVLGLTQPLPFFSMGWSFRRRQICPGLRPQRMLSFPFCLQKELTYLWPLLPILASRITL